jgi:putative membrane protein
MKSLDSFGCTLVVIASLSGASLSVSAQDRETTPNPVIEQKAPASPAEQTPRFTADASRPSESDAAFLKEAAMGGMLEVELGRIAMHNAGSTEVKHFAQHIVADHAKANEELKSLANAEGVKLPAQLDAEHARELKRMQKLSGAAFDREYTKMMLADHQADIKTFNDEGQNGTDPEVKLFALRSLSTLQAHLVLAQAAMQSLTANAAHRSESATR